MEKPSWRELALFFGMEELAEHEEQEELAHVAALIPYVPLVMAAVFFGLSTAGLLLSV